MRGKACAEWDRLDEVIVHKPGIEAFFGLLAPDAFLYEGPFDYRAACREHDGLGDCLRENYHVKMHVLRDTIIERAERDEEFRNELISIAMSAIHFSHETNAEKYKEELLRSAELHYMGDFFDILVLRPTVEIIGDERETFPQIVLRTPLANLFFMRDQQAVTDKGVVVGRSARPQRAFESTLTKLAFGAMDVKIAAEIGSPGTFEGGDFIPMGNFALIGQGDRTNGSGIAQILKSGVGFEEIGVVENPIYERADPMFTMHLDTYFNVAGDDVVVGQEQLLRKAKVTVYQKEGDVYKSLRTSNLLSYVTEKGFKLIPITVLEQLCHASNFLCIKDKRILAINTQENAKILLAKLRHLIDEEKRVEFEPLYQLAYCDFQELNSSGRFFPHKKEMHDYGIDYDHISVKNLTCGFGGIHCMTCGLSRS